MNIYEMSKKGESYRSPSKCGYCRQVGHNIKECPQVAKDYEEWRHYRVPVNQGNPCHWYSIHQPKYWGEWYTKCINAMQKQIDYAEKQKQPKQKRALSPKACGFCREFGHTRRDCDKMTTFLDDAYQANAKWRRRAYDLLVNELGISVGAAIKVKSREGYGARTTTKEHVALVTSVNWDKLNLVCANSTWEERWRQSLHIEIVVEGERCTLRFESNERHLKGVFAHVSGWSNYYYAEKVAAAPKPLDSSWVTEYRDAFNFIAKKYNYHQLEENGIVDLVDDWK